MKKDAIHEYFGIDLELTWKVVKSDVPQLKVQMQKILEDLKR